MLLPTPRGPLSERLVTALAHPPRSHVHLCRTAEHDATDDALTLWILHELHYRGFDDVDERWEWAPALSSMRQRLEQELESRLRADFETHLDQHGLTEVVHDEQAGSDGLVDLLHDLIESDDSPSLAQHLLREGTPERASEFLRQRSVYHLKEADPTAWVVPRLAGPAKAALMEIQFDEYGAGHRDRVHQDLFARGLAATGLSADYGHYLDEARLPILEQNNALSLFGLHRRLRGAALGHLAVFEATSSLPSRTLARALRRLDLPEELAAYYDEHVEADAVHEQLALRDVCETLVREESHLRADVVFGAWACLELEARTARDLLQRWDAA
ncbi:iron-containing redox enzyme family protein [Nocardioides sp.]|uniref:iron-containing redox enzyme family protein n=1 Tax=Nocardioides sp. TaxID=35761 RepID=UPI002B264EE7|nr:iron-containing redox enzyme family protein [Nocardioides sp.]